MAETRETAGKNGWLDRRGREDLERALTVRAAPSCCGEELQVQGTLELVIGHPLLRDRQLRNGHNWGTAAALLESLKS